jgi:protein-disulfide isomerase
LVEFGDYQCPHCAAYHPIVNEVLRRYPDKVRLKFHHYPLITIHPNAMMAAMAAEAAGRQGRFWQMHDLLFEQQPRWSSNPNPEAEFISMAGRLGLDVNRFMQSLRSPDLQQRILADVVMARENNVEGVPAFFIDGTPIEVRPSVEDFVQVLDTRLKNASR